MYVPLSCFVLITASFQHVVVTRTHRSSDKSSGTEHSDKTPDPDPTFAQGEKEKSQDMLTLCGRKRARRNVTRTTSRVTIYQGVLGSIWLIERTTHLTGKQEGATPINKEVRYLIHPTFLRIAIGVLEFGIGGRPARFLRFCPILPEDSEIIQICLEGNLEAFRGALIWQEVPIHA